MGGEEKYNEIKKKKKKNNGRFIIEIIGLGCLFNSLHTLCCFHDCNDALLYDIAEVRTCYKVLCIHLQNNYNVWGGGWRKGGRKQLGGLCI